MNRRVEEMVTEHITAVLVGRSVVAVVNYHNGEVFDWAAYQATSRAMPVHEIADHGDKIGRADASKLFPQIPEEKWRP